MSPSDFDAEIGETAGFDSRDSVIVYNDQPGDTTVRPARPLLLRLALAERERLARWLGQAQQPPLDKPADGPVEGGAPAE